MASPLPRRPRVARFAVVAALSAVSLAAGLSACNSSSDHTFAFVYSPSANSVAGLVNAYGVRTELGNLYLLPDSPIPSGGRNPTAIAANPDHHAIYITNHDDSTVVDFTIGTDGKIYPQNTYNITTSSVNGTFPTSVAVSADGKFLYVTYKYQDGYTTASPGPGGVSVFPILNDYTLGPPINVPIGRAPVAVATSATAGFVYVVAQDSAAVAAGATQTSNLFAFSADASTGALTLLAGQTINSGNVPSFGYPSGQAPASVIEDPTGSYLYVTDTASNTLLTYSVTAGVPTQIASATVTTGNGPRGMAIDPSGKFLFVANYEGTIGEYILGGGLPTLSTTAPSSAAGAGTTCVAVEPSQGNYVYASGSLSNTITGYQIIPADGTLRPILNSPYSASTLPLCLVAVPQTY
jgi:DNA-binding beta-propeller fold protein YncE